MCGAGLSPAYSAAGAAHRVACGAALGRRAIPDCALAATARRCAVGLVYDAGIAGGTRGLSLRRRVGRGAWARATLGLSCSVGHVWRAGAGHQVARSIAAADGWPDCIRGGAAWRQKTTDKRE